QDPAHAAVLAEGPEGVTAPGQQLVSVGLVAHVPEDLVARGVELRVQRDRQLDRAQACPEVTPGARDRVDDRRAKLACELAQLVRAHLPEVRWSLDPPEQRVRPTGFAHGGAL